MNKLQMRLSHHKKAMKSAIDRKDLHTALVHNFFLNELKYMSLLCLFSAWSGSSLPHYDIQEFLSNPYI